MIAQSTARGLTIAKLLGRESAYSATEAMPMKLLSDGAWREGRERKGDSRRAAKAREILPRTSHCHFSFPRPSSVQAIKRERAS